MPPSSPTNEEQLSFSKSFLFSGPPTLVSVQKLWYDQWTIFYALLWIFPPQRTLKDVVNIVAYSFGFIVLKKFEPPFNLDVNFSNQFEKSFQNSFATNFSRASFRMKTTQVALLMACMTKPTKPGILT